MPTLDRIEAFADDLTAIRRDFHEHPELGFQEVRTAAKVAQMLEGWGIEVTRGIGKTGVVGVLKGDRPGRTIGLRADMDALPIHEQTNLPYASKNPGIMHACGHDSHTTMLLGAARYLAETRDFAGTAVFIFQPAEEGLGGARAMIADGLFDRFPCDELYGLHNSPSHGPGEFGVKKGPAMAGASFFDITITGQGSHAARPEESKDPVVIGAGLVSEIQSIVSRNLAPTHPVVVSITQFHAGTAYNVIPETATMAGTVRYFDPEDMARVEKRLRALCSGLAVAHDCQIELDLRNVFDVLMNDDQRAEDLLEAARNVVGDENARLKTDLVMGSEDMADMLRVVPGAYCTLGHGGNVPLHNPGYVFDDAALPVGASFFARMVEMRGAAA
ncbi:amidohydrolase [Defluviimonas sp. 20V17]|uniref:Hippurate hydrolase n=1 Tax=Allgaiera indica TaxID=765699 RepID=A0AAN4USV3_9RHOB|nr:M20 aminoacylase family protein [Allgaiera indica]KDB02020.1 amidohydrolase [Defluviimonas sp. 20V17]GHE03305.1 hippurate hydrolase [Allgaiera indica]SDX23110.1 hippurate hydrolase [Allgaiera indica]